MGMNDSLNSYSIKGLQFILFFYEIDFTKNVGWPLSKMNDSTIGTIRIIIIKYNLYVSI